MIEFWLLIVIIAGATLFFIFSRKVIALLVNSFLGLLGLLGLNLVFDTAVKINVWSLLITGIGGLIGFAIVIALHLLGLAF